MPQRILAVEIAGDHVRGAAADRTWNTFDFIGVFEARRQHDEPDVALALARLVEKTGHPDILITALPSESVTKRLLELPFADARRLHQVVPFALEEHLPYPVDGAMVAFARVGRQDDHSLVLAAFARTQDVREHLELLARAGLDPRTVTLAPFALAAMFARARNGAEPTAHLVIEADAGSTSVVLLDKGGVPRAMRTVSASLLGADGTAPSLGDGGPVVNAVRQTVLAHAADLDDADLVITGPGATVPRVRSLLSDALSMKPRDAREFDCSALFGGARPDLTRFASTVAMLLGEMPMHPVDLLNFRQGELAFKGRTRGDYTAFATPAILAACLAGLVVLHFALGAVSKLHRISLIDRQISAVAAPVLGENASSDPMAQLRSGIASMNKRLRLIGGNLARNSALDTLLAVSEAIPPRFPVQMEDVEIDANGLRITGQADSFGTVDQVKKALDQSGHFGTISVTHARAAADPSKVEFRMSAEFKDSVGKTD